MGISATVTGIGGWTVGPVVGRRPAGVARDAVHPGSGARAVLVVVDGRFTGRGLPDPETVARAAVIGSPLVVPMLDAGLLEDGSRWYVTPAAPGPVLDPAAGCSPRRAAAVVEAVARALAAVHAAGLVHGLVGPAAVVPATARHADRPIGTTLLLDTGVAALLGDRAGELAQAAGVSLPDDRGPASDVHALGGLLLRLLTASAPAGPALAALPVPLRALLSAMLDEHPERRPSADAVAQQLAGLREGLLATGPVELPRAATAPVAVVSAPAPAPRTEIAPRIAVPPPIAAPHTAESPIVVPRAAPTPAPSLWTGPVPVALPDRPGRRRVGRVLLLAGGVGLAGLLVGVVTHLPLDRGQNDGAVAAAAENGVFAAPASPAADSVASSTSASGPAAPSVSASARGKHAASPVRASVPPAFVRPTAVVPSPLAASATSPSPSRNTTPPPSRPTGSAPSSSAPSSSSPSSSTPSSSAPSSSTPSSAPPSSSDPAPESSSPSDPPTSSAPADDPTASEPSSPSGTPSSDPSTPSADASSSPSEPTATDPTDSPAA